MGYPSSSSSGRVNSTARSQTPSVRISERTTRPRTGSCGPPVALFREPDEAQDPGPRFHAVRDADVKAALADVVQDAEVVDLVAVGVRPRDGHVEGDAAARVAAALAPAVATGDHITAPTSDIPVESFSGPALGTGTLRERVISPHRTKSQSLVVEMSRRHGL